MIEKDLVKSDHFADSLIMEKSRRLFHFELEGLDPVFYQINKIEKII